MWRGGGDDREAGPPLADGGASVTVVEAEFIDLDGTVRQEPLSRGAWRSSGFPRCGSSRRFGGSGTDRAGGGSPPRASTWVTNPGWSGAGCWHWTPTLRL